jgi:hypothetical protein
MRYLLLCILTLVSGCAVPLLPDQLATGFSENKIELELEGRKYLLIPLKVKDNWKVFPITALNEGGGMLRPVVSSDRAASIKALEVGTGCSVQIESIVHEPMSSKAAVTC